MVAIDMGENCKCAFYSVRTRDWQNQVAVRTYRNGKRMWGYCTTNRCPNGGDMPDGEKRFDVNEKTTIPYECWLGMLKGRMRLKRD